MTQGINKNNTNYMLGMYGMRNNENTYNRDDLIAVYKLSQRFVTCARG